MEHRKSPRIEGQLSILVYKRGLPVGTGQIRDASRRGVFIKTDYRDVRLNQPLQLAFQLPESRDSQHTLTGHVVRHSEHGFGLDFDSANNDHQAIFQLILWLNGGEPGAPDRPKRRLH